MSLLIKGASILGGAPQDVRIVDGFISEVGTLEVMVKEECIQANGLVLLPGFVDLHTHVREPGREDAETIDSASRAAVIGGYTAVSPMATVYMAFEGKMGGEFPDGMSKLPFYPFHVVLLLLTLLQIRRQGGKLREQYMPELKREESHG